LKIKGINKELAIRCDIGQQGKIRVNWDPDDARSADQAARILKTGRFFMPLLKSSSAAREALAQAIAISSRRR
jgi:hypothetical protein